jgi:Ca2+-dependent lipid-binding protein
MSTLLRRAILLPSLSASNTWGPSGTSQWPLLLAVASSPRDSSALVFFGVFAAHFATRFGGGFGMCLVICAACATYYSASITRVRHRARDDISRELAKQRLYTESESADWINNFLRRFWLAYEPLLSATIVLSVDQVLSENCPGFLESLRLTTFTLGTKAPRIEHVKTYAETDDETVVMDMKLSFTPNDTADLTPRQAAGKVNPKIVLSIKVGKGVATISKDVVVEDITFTGLMRFKLKMMSNFPNVRISLLVSNEAHSSPDQDCGIQVSRPLTSEDPA